LTSYTSNKGLQRELKKPTSQRINNPLKKWANEQNRQFSKEDVQMDDKNMNKCPTSLVIK
jgi:hypothetical protein